MAMELLGGNMPAGQPVAVASGNRTHVFAIAAGGTMNHWTSTDGGVWSGPATLPGGNLAASFPCTISPQDKSVHVFAIANGGPLTHWRSNDGLAWGAPSVIPTVGIPGGYNGLAAASPIPGQVDLFAVTPQAISQYTFAGTNPLPLEQHLPFSGGLNRCVLAAVSARPGTLDVFAVEPNMGLPLRWHFDGASWTRSVIAGPVLNIRNNAFNVNLNSFAATVNPASGRIGLLAITQDMRMTHWAVDGAGAPFKQLPVGQWALVEGVPAVVATTDGSHPAKDKFDVFAIGRGGPLQGGPLIRWHLEDDTWEEPIAYESGLAAGGLGAVSGAGGLEAFGFQSGANNPLLRWPAGIASASGDGWVNWAGNRRVDHPAGHCYPRSLEEVVSIVKSAARQGKEVRAVGSSWSFTDAAVTTGYIVETSRLSRVLKHVIPTAQSGGATSILPDNPSAPRLVHVEAGIKLEDLMVKLDELQLAPWTLGGAAGQTLAGVISTSVHGGHYRLPPIPDWVRAIHLVAPDGRQYWIEPADRRVTDPAQLAKALGSAVTIKYADDWFDSVLVGVGSLGIIYSVVLEVREQYKMQETRESTTWTAARARLGVGSAVFQPPVESVQLVIDPGTISGADPACLLFTRQTVPMATPSTGGPQFDPLGAFCECHGMLHLLFDVAAAAGIAVLPVLEAAVLAVPFVAVAAAPFIPLLLAANTLVAALPVLDQILAHAGPGAVGDLVGAILERCPQVIPELTTTLTNWAYPAGTQIAIAHQLMAPHNSGECAARGLALEVAIDTAGDAHLAFTDAIIALLKDESANGRHLAGWFALRFVGPSRAILSPAHSKMTCYVEFTGLRTLRSTRSILDRLEALGRTFGAIQHWGMHNDLTAPDVARGYPRLDTWRQTRWELTNGGTARTFDNDFTRRCALSDPPGTHGSYERLGADQITSGPGVCSWASGRLDVFVRGTDGTLHHKWFDGGNWSAYEQLGATGIIVGDPTAVSWGYGRIDVFVRGTDDALYQKSFDDGAWSDYERLAVNQVASGPGVCSWASGRLDVFVRGTDGALYHKWFDGGNWYDYEQLGSNEIVGDPVAVSWGYGRIDVFVRGTDDALYHKWYDGNWSDYEQLGGNHIASGPGVCSWASGRLDVFVRGTDGALYHKWFDGGNWYNYEQLGANEIVGDPAAMSWGNGRIDVFVRGTDYTLYHKWFEGNWR